VQEGQIQNFPPRASAVSGVTGDKERQNGEKGKPISS
jgi:hypothetical protein